MIEAVVNPRSAPSGPTLVAPDPGEQAAAGLVRRHWATVRRYLRILGADAALADDLAQDAFVVALRKGIEDRGAPTAAWLRRTARNLFLEHTRQRRAVGLDAAELVFEEQRAGDGVRREALRDCLSRLTERGQAAVRFAYGERKSWAQIGEALGMQASGVKTLLRRCRDTLRSCIERAVDREQAR